MDERVNGIYTLWRGDVYTFTVNSAKECCTQGRVGLRRPKKAIILRNLHGSGHMYAKVSDICMTLRGDAYRVVANTLLNKFGRQQHRF